MAETIIYGIAQEVLKNLGSMALNEIASTWGFKDQLEKLKVTINTIKDVLLDAEEKQANNQAVRNWLARLTTAVYAADDLFDKFNTIASRKQLLTESKLTKEVKTFFSDSNQIAFACKISRKIRSIREELEVIFEDGKAFNLAQRAIEQGRLIAVRRDQTHSYIDTQEVIGRDDDKNAIINLLLSSNSTENENENEGLSILPIVGIGGMGKTTLAQLIYNNPRVQEYFELRLWVCVAEDFDIKLITEKILRSATNKETPNLDMDQLQSQLRNEVGGKKYLLVLDDVWEEDPNKWGELKLLLKTGRNGSKILLTTRSRKVAEIMGIFPHHELQVLSEEKSWDLFEKMAFKSGEVQLKPHLVDMGKELVKKCANVPLAIVSLGRLLRHEHESKWMSFKDKNIVNVTSVLKLSYQHLLSPLKNCFAYCALFPKDHVFDKEMLIELWIAEGFIIPDFNGGRNLEDVAEDYFLNLLQRGFFQEVTTGEWGDIICCKMHDLVHDLAQEEAKAKCKLATFNQIDFEGSVLHLSFAGSMPNSWKIPNEMLNLKLLRTFLCTQESYVERYGSHFSKSNWHQMVTKFRHLRILDLRYLKFKSLPSSIGKLIHLRYLNLTASTIKTLPDTITDLYNLQTLNLNYCWKLKKLPVNIQKLSNLRSLDIDGCSSLIYMPSRIGELTSLNKLSRFSVSLNQEPWKKPSSTANLGDLKKLNKLRGKLSVYIRNSYGDINLDAIDASITDKHGLTELNVYFAPEMTSESNKKQQDETVLEGLKPHCNLRTLRIQNYGGEKLPSWLLMDNLGELLPKLVNIELQNCRNCEQVPSFSQLPFLKSLHLEEMESVVYMEREVLDVNLFFPCLEYLHLVKMKNLKSWWNEEQEAATSSDDANKIDGISSQQHLHHLLSLQFQKVCMLTIEECPNLINMPLCPSLEELTLVDTNKKLRVVNMDSISAPPTSSTSFYWGWTSKLKELDIDDVEYLIAFSQLGLGPLRRLVLRDKNLESTERLDEIFATISTSLRLLTFRECHSLRTISKGFEHLTVLVDLVFWECKELKVLSTNEAAVEDGSQYMMPWKAYKNSLQYLGLCNNQVESLPSGIQYLTNIIFLDLFHMEKLEEIPEWISCLSSLQFLELVNCPKLRSLPQSFQNLSSLKTLQIYKCPGLTKRCQSSNGADWHKIQHIPRITVKTNLPS